MLTAIVHGKAGRVRLPDSDQDVSWREFFRAREDLLTAVFFGRLRYLSDDALRRVMAAMIGDTCADTLGKWQTIDFWPRLEGAKDRRWVEPDVLLHFENARVMIEVKPPFGGDQSVTQWRSQLNALHAELRDAGEIEAARVHYVALGRTSRVPFDALRDFDASEAIELHLHRVEWEALAHSLPEWIADAGRTDAAVFTDWVEAFGLFGVRSAPPPPWEALLAWVVAHPVAAALSPPRPINAPPAAPISSASDWRPLLNFARIHPLEATQWK